MNDKLDPDILPIYANMAINKRQNLTEIKANIKTLKSIKEEKGKTPNWDKIDISDLKYFFLITVTEN